MGQTRRKFRLQKSSADRIVVWSLAAAAAACLVLAIGAVGITSLKQAAQSEAIRQAGQGIPSTLDEVDQDRT